MDIAGKVLIQIPLASEVLWLFIAIAIIIFLIMAIILRHHWNYYGVQDNSKKFVKSLFWIISVFLIVIMLFSILFFEI